MTENLLEDIKYVLEAQEKLGLSMEFVQYKLTELVTGKKVEKWNGLIVDREKSFKGEDTHATLYISSNLSGKHTLPSLYMKMENSLGETAYDAFTDMEVVKEMIEHMAEMCALNVIITDKAKTGN